MPKLKSADEKGIVLNAHSALLLLAAVIVARGTSFMMSKQLLSTLEPINLIALRFLLAFTILFLLFHKRVVPEVRRNPKIILASVILGGTYFLCMVAELNAMKYTDSSTCAFLENSAIVIVPIAEAILLRRLPERIIMISAAVTFCGIGFIVLKGGSMGFGKGEILAMVSALLYTAAIIIGNRFSRRYDSFCLGVIYVGAIAAMGLVASFMTGTTRLPSTGYEWMLLILLAVVCSCFGFTFQPVAQEYLSSETAGITAALNPLTAAILGSALLGETFGVRGIIGAVLILGGIVIPNVVSHLKTRSSKE